MKLLHRRYTVTENIDALSLSLSLASSIIDDAMNSAEIVLDHAVFYLVSRKRALFIDANKRIVRSGIDVILDKTFADVGERREKFDIINISDITKNCPAEK